MAGETVATDGAGKRVWAVRAADGYGEGWNWYWIVGFAVAGAADGAATVVVVDVELWMIAVVAAVWSLTPIPL